MVDSKRLEWVDAAKGISIILVVMMYSAFNTGEYTGQVGFMHYIIGFASPFRMPEFFLISGLFLSQVISKPWPLFCDRRVVHYLYFYILWCAIMLGLKVGIYEADPTKMLAEFALALVQPYGVLWFVYLLAVFGLVAKSLYHFRIPAFGVLPVAVAIQIFTGESVSYVATQFSAYFVYFYLGFIAGPFVVAVVGAAERHPRFAWALLFLWAMMNGLLVYSSGYMVQPTGVHMGLAGLPGLRLVLAVAGTLALCVTSGLLTKLPFSAWLTLLGRHSLAIYLVFTIPMSIFRAFALKSELISDTGVVSFVVMIVSILSSLALYAAVKITGIAIFIFERPRWARFLERRFNLTRPRDNHSTETTASDAA
ncbi:acyltransferase family protein [Neorhizobium sp. LjRoot104]|uniref:acyltransferase family protein n=1 Tax=Neorhizobium sp. LjRoot104 TaxID=3342254 RepID=UPI003ECE77BB